MPAKPRPRLTERRVEEVRRPRPAVAGFRDRALEILDRFLVDRDLLALFRLGDRFALRLRDPRELDGVDSVSPFSRRILFTVLAATSSARAP